MFSAQWFHLALRALAFSTVALASASAHAVVQAAPAGSTKTSSDRAIPSVSAGPALGLGGALGQIGSSLAGSLGSIGSSLGNSLGNIGSSLGGSLNQFIGNLGVVFSELGGNYVDPTPGTVSEQGYIEFQGTSRRFVLVRPETAVAGAPVLVLLHAHGLAPERMANLTRAGRLAADYGTWVYLPEAQNGDWNDDPSSLIGADDVGFIGKLIDTAIADHQLDARRVYAAGYSNGGFMAERLGCQLSSKIAGIAAVAATLRDSVASICQQTHPMPVALFLGTSDLIVPYNGIPTLASAVGSIAFWAQQSSCTAGQTSVSQLPDVDPTDGTRINLTRYTACPTTADVRLYTVTNGGHTWPGSIYSGYTLALGKTSFDIDATLEIWRVLTPFSLPAVP